MLFADKPMWLDCGHALGCAVFFFSSCLMQWFTHWISKPPSWFGWFYYSNHGHNYCLFESLKLFVKCLQWLFFLGWGVIFFSCQGLYKRECGCPEFRISHRFLHVSSLHSGLCPPPKRYQRDPKCLPGVPLFSNYFVAIFLDVPGLFPRLLV